MLVAIEVLKPMSALIVGLFEAKKIRDEFLVFIINCKDLKLVLDSSATKLIVSTALKQNSLFVEGIKKWSCEVFAIAFNAIPCTLKQNDGVKVIRTMTGLQEKHTNGENAWVDMKRKKKWDAYDVNTQTFKTTIEVAFMLQRVDDIVSGIILPSFFIIFNVKEQKVVKNWHLLLCMVVGLLAC